MTKQPNKKKFEVLENETITDCLARMEQEGYAPSRRMEEPITYCYRYNVCRLNERN
ncbi:Uncharacterised protein [Streptococcus pneumoniae]|nr:Uncharacterised protein [Streptococcus pneumoniae]